MMLKPRWRMISISFSVNAPKIAILALLESFFSLHGKKECPRKVMKKKADCPSVFLSVCRSVCEWHKTNCLRLKVFEFDLMNHLKSLFQMNQYMKERFIPKQNFPDSCSHLFSNQPQLAKTVNQKHRNK